jgi:DNA-binding NtrC family response regulator
VRELENVIERAVVLSSNAVIQPGDLALAARESAPPGDGAARYQTRLERVEREVLREALQAHGGAKRAAARALNIALSTFYVKLKKYQL